MSGRAIDTRKLREPSYGLFERVGSWLDRFGSDKVRIELRLAPEERDAGLTVNEYETLLIRDDLPEALRDPLAYMVRRGRNLARHPATIPGKTRDYATYDLIHLYNEFLEYLPFGRSIVDRFMSVLSTPAYRILRLKRSVSLLVSSSLESGPARIVSGKYQTPILVQHGRPQGGVCNIDVTLRTFQ